MPIVPISTIPTLISSLYLVDVMVSPATVRRTITRLFLARTDNVSGGTVTASVRNAISGGGEGIEVTLSGAESEDTNTGAVVVEASEPIYLRVTADDGESRNLRGYMEIDQAVTISGGLLTTLVRVKAFGRITTSADDTMLNELIASASDEVQQWCRRQFVQTTATAEKHNPRGAELFLQHSPVVSVTSVTEHDTALVEDTDFEVLEEDKQVGRLVRLSGDVPVMWAQALRAVSVTYDHGYSSVPDAIAQLATELVVHDYNQAKGRFGLSSKVLDTGGGSTYRTRPDIWRDSAHRASAYRVLQA